MTDTPSPEPRTPTIPKGAGNIWTDIGPVLIYIVSYNLLLRLPEGDGLFTKSTAIYWSTGIFTTAVLGVIAWTLAQGRKLPPMLMITGSVVFVFFLIGVALQDPKFFYYKPTIINLLFATTIVGSILIGRNIWKTAFQHAFSMPDRAWRVFGLRWAAFYVFLAILNEVIWRTQTEEFWMNSKGFLLIPISILFMLANLPFLMKHTSKPAEAGGDNGKAEEKS